MRVGESLSHRENSQQFVLSINGESLSFSFPLRIPKGWKMFNEIAESNFFYALCSALSKVWVTHLTVQTDEMIGSI